MCDRDLYARRRAAFAAAMASAGAGEAIAVLPSAPEFPRADGDYRPDSDLCYVTGFDEPQSALVLAARDARATFFVRRRDPTREIWDGPRAGVDGAKSAYGADEAFAIDDLAEQLPRLLADKRRLYYRLGRDRAFDDEVLRAIDRVRARARLGVAAPTEIVDPGEILHEMRLVKTEPDLAAMRKGAAITREAHLRAMAAAKAGMHEYEIEALIHETFRKHGCERPAYGSIVGSGPNATILHYRANRRAMQDGELLLIDAGCEYAHYASDVTRTFPVSGRFTREQQAIYEVVLEAQVGGVAMARAGATIEAIHTACVASLTRGLVRLGLLAGDPETLVADGAYKRFYMHRTSHWLGMDVHDVGRYFVDGKPRVLAPGNVLTIEPGIYVARDDDAVPAEWRGIGVRIEDDVLVTEGDPEVLTAAIPKSVQEVERACSA